MDKSEIIKQETIDAFEDPQVGDRFHEMYSYWMFVIQVEPEIITMEANPPCEFPKDAKIRRYGSVDEFRARFGYQKDMLYSYWVDLCDRGNDVSGWLESAEGEKK